GRSGKGNYVYYRHECPKTKTKLYLKEPELFALADSLMREIEYVGDTQRQIQEICEEQLGRKDRTVAREERYLHQRLEELKRKKKGGAKLFLLGSLSQEEVQE